jgi:hypothetical protein
MLERMESTESMRENERFSPIPWTFSPPISPPPLSLYTSVALLHYHIHHHGPLSEVGIPPEIETLSSGTTSPSSSRNTRSAPNSPGSTRVSRVVSPDCGLEEFLAVKRALQTSPFVVPSELNPTNSENRMENQATDDIRSIGKEKEEECMVCYLSMEKPPEDSLPTEPEVTLEVSEAERDSVVELVEGYSTIESDIGDMRSAQSSPFIDNPNSIPRILEPVESPSFTCEPLGPIDAKTESQQINEQHEIKKEENNELPPTAEDQSLSANVQVSRVPSLQRRGQEYLSQFLAKRNLQEPQPEQRPPTPPRPSHRFSPFILLYLLVVLSVVANIIFLMQLNSVEKFKFAIHLNTFPKLFEKVMLQFSSDEVIWSTQGATVLEASAIRIQKVGWNWAVAEISRAEYKRMGVQRRVGVALVIQRILKLFRL